MEIERRRRFADGSLKASSTACCARDCARRRRRHRPNGIGRKPSIFTSVPGLTRRNSTRLPTRWRCVRSGKGKRPILPDRDQPADLRHQPEQLVPRTGPGVVGRRGFRRRGQAPLARHRRIPGFPDPMSLSCSRRRPTGASWRGCCEWPRRPAILRPTHTLRRTRSSTRAPSSRTTRISVGFLGCAGRIRSVGTDTGPPEGNAPRRPEDSPPADGDRPVSWRPMVQGRSPRRRSRERRRIPRSKSS